MNSHEYATKLQQLADFLLTKPEFDMPWSENLAYSTLYYFDKDQFLGAVKSLGAGRKEWKPSELIFHPNGTDMLRLGITRNKVCKLVREAEYECEPLLSSEEEAQVGA